MRVKICGVTRRREVELLDTLAVDFAGLWHGTPGGHAELSLPALRELTAVAHATGRVRPVLVTLVNDAARLREIVESTGVRWVQLHGYQPPDVVRSLKESVQCELTIVKVLHVRGDSCLERPLIGHYERAGVDLFLVDTTTEDCRVGSTGQPCPPAAVASAVERLERPFLLAGGISADNFADYLPVLHDPRFHGIDVDTNARDQHGRLSRDRVQAITTAWPGHRTEGPLGVIPLC